MSTYALFDESGKFLAGRVMSETESSLQIELDSGKRVKVKSSNVLLRFNEPQPGDLLLKAAGLAQEIDVDLVWEVAPAEDFSFEELAVEYFGAQASTIQRASMLLRLFETPHYFHRRGKGRFHKAPAEIVQQALAALARKQQQLAQIDSWAQELVTGSCPAPIREQLYKILFKPDKNGPEYKAVVEAAKQAQSAPLDLLKQAGAIESPYQFHWRRFLFEFFPKGTVFPVLEAPAIKDDLPRAAVQAFSIDDSSTTEIDDALSVQGLGSGTVCLGIHIAAPGLAIVPQSALDQVARNRYSTVYMPGYKLTMLPDSVVERYTLQAGRDCPAVSLYVWVNETTLEIQHTETRLEQVPIAANLRHDELENQITLDSLNGHTAADYAFADELAFCFRLAQHLKAAREVLRGKPETFTRPDYNFRLLEHAGSEPSGLERVQIEPRQRGTPLDLIVAEAMILANSTWGGWLHELGLPGIYRSQASLAPGIKVRMGTKALPHAGMGVKQYTWATSPLRRYVDLVNQWQIIAAARHGRTALLAAPFKPKDAELFSIISGFETAYSAYNGFQTSLERYWTLRYIQQNQIQELEASVLKDGLVRADSLPLVFRALGADNLPRAAKVRVRIAGLDELTLEVHAQVIARLDVEQTAKEAPEGTDLDEQEEGEAAVAGGITLAIDVQDAENAGESTPSSGTATV